MSDNREMVVLNGEQIDEIVRCKDCVYWQEDLELPDCSYCSMNDMVFDADDFCSRGERKDEVEE